MYIKILKRRSGRNYIYKGESHRDETGKVINKQEYMVQIHERVIYGDWDYLMQYIECWREKDFLFWFKLVCKLQFDVLKLD
ncbi:hypothetical protein [Clostridium cylindrosporum]|uniref:Uncharacterized protein n=1 Tax=Clostridium cylindrosporum DSM 605 TaxID=1121307 RepID=A0A0J8G189_CLOCY|nr:hypothetical protein [Clostridium cylindrosporum]KMT21506.1 hypothetical protein CLCY_2c02670 [Clostridium cylindrosporum DSM 605]